MTRIDPSSPDYAERSQSVPRSQSGHPVPEADVRKRERLSGEATPDRVSVSSDARLLSRVHQTISDTPDVREELVKRIKDAVNNGSYQFNPREIAEAMLKSGALTTETKGK